MHQLNSDKSAELDVLAQSLYGVRAVSHSRVTAAKVNGDLDTLRAYEKLISAEGINTTRIDLVISFFRRIGTQEVSSFLTAQQVITLVTVGLAVSEATDFAHPHLHSPDHDQLVLESLNHLDRTEDMSRLITERHILDPESLRIMLKQMDEHHPVLTVGIL